MNADSRISLSYNKYSRVDVTEARKRRGDRVNKRAQKQEGK